MKCKLVFFVIIFFMAMGVACAGDFNSTDGVYELPDSGLNETVIDENVYYQVEDDSGDIISDDNQTDSNNLNNTYISIESNSVKSVDVLKVSLKDENGTGLKNKWIIAQINNKNRYFTTDSEGVGNFNVNLQAGKYNVTFSFRGDEKYNSTSKTITLKVSVLKTQVNCYSNFVLNGNMLYVFLVDEFARGVSGKVSITICGKTYVRKTDANGKASIQILLDPLKKYAVNVKFDGNDRYKSCFKKLNIMVTKYTFIRIENTKLLTNGYLRVYLKDASKADIWKKTMTIKVGSKIFTKTTNSEGMIVFKPKAGEKTYKVMVKYGKYVISKIVKGIKGNVKDPLSVKIPLKNGVPDIDLMPGNYVTADGNAKYTLKKSQYLEVLKRDSYCLFLNNKLTKYVFFKTTSHPNTNHIIQREKWNVIEKEINRRLVDANRYGYWPASVTVSLKGKAYTYHEVRDIQDTGYTCGPTSCSMCSQVLKNYLCEKYIAKKSGTTPWDGTACSGMVMALDAKCFNCTYFYRDSCDYAMNELKKGGCALVFHTKNHYVAVLDISNDGKRVLVSNSYGTYNNIPSGWLTVKYMKTKYYKDYDDGLIVRLNYKLSNSVKNSINCYYTSMGKNWAKHNIHEVVN